MPALSATLNALIPVFESSFDIAYQQLQSELRDAVDTKPGSGDRMRGQILSELEATEYTERGGETVYTDLDASFWNVFPQAAEAANLIDEYDDEYLATISRPDSEIVQSHAGAIGRQIDNKIVRAATAAAYRGKNGTTSSSFDTTNQRVAVNYRGPTLSAANCGLNFYKVARASRILDDAEVPEEGRVLVIRAAQMEDLYADVIDNHAQNITDLEINANQRMITRLYGFQVIKSQRILVADTVTSAGTDVASDLAFQRNALKCRVWKDRQTFMDILPERRHNLAIRTVVNAGATRARDEGVVEILSDQSP